MYHYPGVGSGFTCQLCGCRYGTSLPHGVASLSWLFLYNEGTFCFDHPHGKDLGILCLRCVVWNSPKNFPSHMRTKVLVEEHLTSLEAALTFLCDSGFQWLKESFKVSSGAWWGGLVALVYAWGPMLKAGHDYVYACDQLTAMES